KLLRLGVGDECGNLAGQLADDFVAKGKLTVSPGSSMTITGDCPVEAGGGYTGFEHYLYRIEIAEPDSGGNDRFKWSQFNGGLVGRGEFTSTGAGTGTVRVRANNQMINHCGLTGFYLEALAYDAALGHWRVMLSADATLPQDDTLSLTNINGTWPATAPATAFFRLWNGIELVTSFPIPGMGVDPNELPNQVGIHVALEAPAAGKYAPGDYWTFPVRASGAAVDADWIAANWPSDAAPQGIHYHRVPLAILNWTGPANVTITAPTQIDDCRRVFQPLTRLRGCCRYTVGDGMVSFGDFDTIQAAINALPTTGGEICVLPGQYPENVTINGKDNVTIRGCGAKSRVISQTAGQPVIAISDADNVRLEGLALVGGESSPGVRVAATPLCTGITLRNLHITAATRGAIEVMGGRFVTIEDCRIRMNDVFSFWHAVFVLGDDVAIERNTIFVERAGDVSSGLGTSGSASAGRGGLQIGGTSERVRIIDNWIEAGIGNGITLGSLVVDNEEGEPEPSDGGGVEVFDECNPCKPGDGSVPPGDDDDETPTYHSAGPLYDVLIERNRIRHMGLNGIGVIGFFDLSKEDEFITVEYLRIVENEIRGCLRRTLAPIPAAMRNSMGYGGIALADVEFLIIRHNLIEDNGPNHLEPICGIFLLHGEGVDISDNRIMNNGAKTEQPSNTAKDGRRGGINIVFAIATTAPTPIFGFVVPVQDGMPAVKIHDNVVSHPLGQALSLQALGPVSVVDNHLTSRGMVLKLNPLSPGFLAATVMIMNLGVSNEFYSQITGFSGVVASSTSLTTGLSTTADAVVMPKVGLDDKQAGFYLANGNVLFSDNRVDLNLLETGVGFAISSIAIMTLDDLGFHNNQCECNLLDDFVFIQALLFGFSLRVSDNRFKEGWFNAILSAVTIGLMNATTGNQSTHCILVYGLIAALKVDAANKSLFDVFSKVGCDNGKTKVDNAAVNHSMLGTIVKVKQ
ncbi:MAG TPA: hypothetical protein VJS66_09445, partial [Burkholderiales bacterium]|nr:hypothetical protein [Burkholderiales bacterium]